LDFPASPPYTDTTLQYEAVDMDKVLSIVNGLACGLVLWPLARIFLCAIDTLVGTRHDTSWMGTLACLGGPWGTTGGIVVLVVFSVACGFIQEYLNWMMAWGSVKGMLKAGSAPEAIAARIEKLPLSRGLKEKMKRAAQRKEAPR
jgi:hypothetical protein